MTALRKNHPDRPKTKNCSSINKQNSIHYNGMPKKLGSASSHLYLKGTIYYFRYAFPEPVKMRIGRSEIRLSLETPYRKKDIALAKTLYAELQHLIKNMTLEQECVHHVALSIKPTSEKTMDATVIILTTEGRS